jgi:hypothetical protein
MRKPYRLLVCSLVAVLGAAPVAFAHVDVPGLDNNGQCVGDADSNAAVTINELILAVNNALDGCADPTSCSSRAWLATSLRLRRRTAASAPATRSSSPDFRLYVSTFTVRPGAEVPALDRTACGSTRTSR